jgi:putative transposase
LHRLDLAFSAFFRRMKAGQTPGAPRFRSAHRWNQLEFPHGDRAIKLDAAQRRITIPGVGSVTLLKGRVVPATFGRVFIVHKNDRWYAVFECHREIEPLPETGQSVGIDRGIRAVAALSTGDLVENLRSGSRRKIATDRSQRRLDAVTVKDGRGRSVNVPDPQRRAAVRQLARAKEREANARRDWLHKVSRWIVATFDVIVLEELRLRNMTRSAKGDAENPGRNVKAKSGLNRALLDAGLGMLGTLIREKAAYAARRVIRVDPRYSSQECSRCGHVAASNRVRGRFRCGQCWYRCYADVNAARVILARGRAQLAPARAPDYARGRTHDAA